MKPILTVVILQSQNACGMYSFTGQGTISQKTKYACNKVLHLTPKNCQSEVSFIALDCLNDQIQKVYQV